MKSEKKLKIIKIILISVIVLFPICFFIGFFVDWKFPSWIYISGSSTIQPLMSEIAKYYNKSQIIVNAGGSSTGISQMLDNEKQIGMASKSPSTSLAGLPEGFVNNIVSNPTWKNDQIKTFTIAWDGIGIIYKCNDSSFNLDISSNNANNFFDSFTGLKQFYIDKTNNISLTNSSDGFKIIPFAKTGGASLSGTAEAFLENNPFHKTLSKETKDILKNGTYGELTIQTDESNLSSWNKVKDYSLNSNELLLTYLSAGFIKNNLKSIESAGFKVATLNNVSLFNNNQINIPTYQWYRPFNLLFKIKNMDPSLQEFLTWLKDELTKQNSIVNQQITNLGYSTLSLDSINSMCSNNDINNFYKSDYELLNEQKEVRIKKEVYYGAL